MESAICGPVKSILFYYSTKVGSAADLDMKIVSKIAYLKSRFSPGQIPQTIFGVNHVSPSNWQLAIDRLSVVEQCERPTFMLLEMLSTVHIIHSLYYREAKKPDPDPLGADDLMPIVVYVVARANLQHPQSTFQMISHWLIATGSKGWPNTSWWCLKARSTISRTLTLPPTPRRMGIPDNWSDKGSAINHLSDLENRVTLLDRRLAALERLIQLNGDSLQRYGRRKSSVLLHADFDKLSEIIRGAASQSAEERIDS